MLMICVFLKDAADLRAQGVFGVGLHHIKDTVHKAFFCFSSKLRFWLWTADCRRRQWRIKGEGTGTPSYP